MASASDSTAASEVTFFLTSCLQPKTASARSESSQTTNRTSRLASRSAQRGAKFAPRFYRIAPFFQRLRHMRLQLFVDFAAQAIAPKYVCHA